VLSSAEDHGGRNPTERKEPSVAADKRPVLYVVACGASPAAELPGFVRSAQEQGWDVCVIATPDGVKFLDARNLAGLTGHPVRMSYKRPDEPDVLPPPDAFIVLPATFNTVNKWAQGISDTLALGLLNEAVGLRLPIAAFPWPNSALAVHPVFQRSVGVLREWVSRWCSIPPWRRGRRASPVPSPGTRPAPPWPTCKSAEVPSQISVSLNERPSTSARGAQAPGGYVAPHGVPGCGRTRIVVRSPRWRARSG
jgi:hypothetical protein